jgi:hypothetical protein
MKWKWLLHTVVYLGCLIALLWQSYRIRDLQDTILHQQLYASKRQAQVDACSQFLCEEHSEQRGWQLQLMETQGKLMRCEKAVIAKRR